MLLPVFPSLRHDSIVAHHARGIPASDKQILLRVKEGLKQRRLLRRISAATANAVIFIMHTSLIKYEKCQQPGGYFYQSEINFFCYNHYVRKGMETDPDTTPRPDRQLTQEM